MVKIAVDYPQLRKRAMAIGNKLVDTSQPPTQSVIHLQIPGTFPRKTFQRGSDGAQPSSQSPSA